MPIPEREFIRGNRDGVRGRNETYTICRVNVPVQRFEDERQAGLHPNYLQHEVSASWRCPAHARRNSTAPADLADYVAKKSKLTGKAQEMKVVHRTLEQPAGKNPTCVICRLKIPRARLVEEILGGPNLHPGFRTITVNGRVYGMGKKGIHPDNEPDFRTTVIGGQPWVSAKIGVDPDNVNYESACDFCVVS